MKPVYIIAEVGVNHNGNVDLAKKLIKAAKISGANAVKFQTFKTESLLTKNADMAEYQKENLGFDCNQFEMIKALELSQDDFLMLREYAKNSFAIDFLSTPDDEDSLNFLVDKLNLSWIKIGSGEVTNLFYLKQIASKQKPMILSTGMATLGEVERAVRAIREISDQELILLHCTTNYPCPSNEVNLRAMQTLRQAFNLSVGYSDHTLGSEVSVAAVAMGAVVIEKHLTLNKKMIGPDHSASLDPDEFAVMVKQIRSIEQAMGDGVKWPNLSEQKIKLNIRRRVIAAKKMSAGTLITDDCLVFKRANRGIFSEFVDQVIGMRLAVDIEVDTPIDWDFLKFT